MPSAPGRARLRRRRRAPCREALRNVRRRDRTTSRSTTYPGERVAITDASPSAPRSRDTYSCTMCRALTGAASPQTESISVSTDTASPTCRRRVPSSARSRRLGRSTRRPSTSASSRPSIRKVTCVTAQTRIPQPRSRLPSAPIERRWSVRGAASRHHDPMRTISIIVARTRCYGARCGGRAVPRRRGMRAPGSSPPPNTPVASGASAPARSSSTIHMTWAREPTRSRSRAPSEPRPLDVSPASPHFPSHPSSDASTAVGSRHNADSRRSMRDCGSASTTPSTPLARRHSRPLSLNASRSSCMRLTP